MLDKTGCDKKNRAADKCRGSVESLLSPAKEGTAFDEKFQENRSEEDFQEVPLLRANPPDPIITRYDMVLKTYRFSQKEHTKVHCLADSCSMVIVLPHPSQRRRMKMPLRVCFGFTNPTCHYPPFPEKTKQL